MRKLKKGTLKPLHITLDMGLVCGKNMKEQSEMVEPTSAPLPPPSSLQIIQQNQNQNQNQSQCDKHPLPIAVPVEQCTTIIQDQNNNQIQYCNSLVSGSKSEDIVLMDNIYEEDFEDKENKENYVLIRLQKLLDEFLICVEDAKTNQIHPREEGHFGIQKKDFEMCEAKGSTLLYECQRGHQQYYSIQDLLSMDNECCIPKQIFDSQMHAHYDIDVIENQVRLQIGHRNEAGRWYDMGLRYMYENPTPKQRQIYAYNAEVVYGLQDMFGLHPHH